MPEAKANDLTLHYDEHGDADAPPMLLIMGVGAQMILWPMELVEALVERGFRVIRFDNRDIGLSQKLDDAKVPSIPLAMIMARFGFTPRTPYSLEDMADDAAGLLDALGIDKAHIVGASMGGMIVQHFGAKHSDRALSLTSIMSTTGHRKLEPADKAALGALIKRPKDTEIETIREHGLMLNRAIGSPAYPPDPERAKDRAEETFKRSFYPQGIQRQMAAIIADGDRREVCKRISVPTLVLHGEGDPLVKLEGGKDTAAHIPGAKLHTIPGWGHDLPLELVDEIADAIAGHANEATAQTASA